MIKDWIKYDLKTAVFQPKNMSPQELEEGTFNAQKVVSSNSNIIKSLDYSLRIGICPFLMTGLRHWVVKNEQ